MHANLFAYEGVSGQSDTALVVECKKCGEGVDHLTEAELDIWAEKHYAPKGLCYYQRGGV